MSIPKTIVVVDDEPMVPNCLSASLELDGDHHVVTFQDPVEALAFVRETEIDLIISDFDLPGMDGIQLLSAVRDHDPSVPLQAEDVDYHRYHPLILNAAFLGNLSPDDCRILGFGDARNLVHAFRRKERFPRLNRMAERSLDLRLQVDDLLGRVRARSRRVLGRA